MHVWKCTLTPESLTYLRDQTELRDIANVVEINAEPDTPEHHLREQALDVITLLLRQQIKGIPERRLATLRRQLSVECELIGKA